MISRNYLTAVFTLVAAIVGVGMFTLPYIANQSGLLLIIFYFIILGTVEHWIHKIYAEIILSTKSLHRLPGYAGIYLGPRSKRLMLIVVIVSSYASLLAYTLIGGDFLYQLLHAYWGGSVFFYTSILLALRSAIIAFGLKWITRVETFLTAGLFGTIIIVALFVGDHISLANISLFHPQKFLLPYGAVFFAVGGLAAVNNVCLILKKEPAKISKALRDGMILAILIMLFFTTMIMSISGGHTSPDALSGLRVFIDPIIYKVLLAVGLVTVSTSFLMIGEALEEVYIWDLGWPRGLSWLLVASVPYVLYLLGAQDLTKVVGLAGAITGGMLGAYSLSIALRARKKPQKKSSIHPLLTPTIAHVLTLLFLIGVSYQLWEIFR